MKTFFKTIASVALLLAFTTTGIWAQTQDHIKLQTKDQLKDGSCLTATADLTETQQAIVNQFRDNGKNFRDALRETFTVEQLAILENATLSRAEKQEALHASFSLEQQEMLELQQSLRNEQREQFRANISEGQMKQIRKRLQQSENPSGTGDMVRNRVRQQEQNKIQEPAEDSAQEQLQDQVKQQTQNGGNGARGN